MGFSRRYIPPELKYKILHNFPVTVTPNIRLMQRQWCEPKEHDCCTFSSDIPLPSLSLTVEPWQRDSGDVLGRLEAVSEADAGRRDGVRRLRLPPVVQHGHLRTNGLVGLVK